MSRDRSTAASSGPLGRHGRWTATHFRALALVWAVIALGLGVLAGAGIVGREKDGNRVRCFIADESVFELCELVCGGMRQQVAELDELLSGGPA